MEKKLTSLLLLLLLMSSSAILIDCGGGGGGDEPPIPFGVNVTVTGCDGTGLTLQNNGGDDLSIPGDGTFTFASGLADGSSYQVTILTYPTNPTQSCLVQNGSGTVASADITDVAVSCYSRGIKVYADSTNTEPYYVYGTNQGTLNDYQTWYSVNTAPGAVLLAHSSSGGDVLALGDYKFYIVAAPTQILVDAIELGDNTGRFIDSNTSLYYGNSSVANIYGPPDGVSDNVGVFSSSGGTYSGFVTIQKPVLTGTEDSYSTSTDEVLTVAVPGVLDNDILGFGTSLAITDYDSASVEGGTVVMTADGGFTYTPLSTFAGLDSFTYTVWDGKDQTNGTIKITVLDPTSGELLKIYASNPGDGDAFGSSVSISLNDVIVGAYSEDSYGTDAGAAYILSRDLGGSNMWGERTRINASDGQLGDRFGYSASIDGDYAIVGAPAPFSTGVGPGDAYIFSRNQGGVENWGEVKKLTASDAEEDDNFGISVAINGDYAVVGAYTEDTAAISAGAVYIFHRNQGGTDNWGEVKKIMASDAANYDNFGQSVSIDGDYLIVGASWDDTSVWDTGSAYIFNRNSGGADNWGQVTKLTASTPGEGETFGYSVDIDNTYAIVGAGALGTASNGFGSAYVFQRDLGGTDNWGEVTKLTGSDVAGYAQFGYSVALESDYAVIGAHYKDSNAGAAYLFHRDQGGLDNWGEVEKLSGFDPGPYDHFGRSVDYGNGYVIVGAPWAILGTEKTGATYFFSRP
ncbi:MAG: cadherin-like domain-containing protein [Desulfobacteraceae bacterium]|nr:cadherin-like domain-containing protein [Desulfobacteraceae bacterium]